MKLAGLLLVLVFSVLYFTLAYQLVLFIIVAFILLVSLALAKTGLTETVTPEIALANNNALANSGTSKKVITTFIINEHGECQFDGTQRYQLLASSRVSFFGCWLKVAVKTSEQGGIGETKLKKSYFFYRDSLSAQDYARLARIINTLE